MAAEGSIAREPGAAELRLRVAELEAENAELRRARRVAVELEASRAALRASEARYRLVVESATDYAIFTTDLDRQVTGWNVGAERVLGWPEEEMLGRPADVIFTPEDREAGAPEQEARGALETGRAEDVRWHLRRDGSRLWANGVMLPLRGERGRIGGFLKILRDKTAEKRAADELREKAGFLERVLGSSADCIKVLDLDGRLQFLSASGLSALELDDFGTVRGRPWIGFWPGEAVETVRAAVETARAGGTARFRGFAPTAKGTPRWWDVRVTPIPGEDGRPERLLAISRDTTEQKRAEEALLRLNGTLEAEVAERTAERDRMWKTSPDLMLVIGFDGVFRRVNPAWTAVLGYAPEELVGRHVNEFVAAEDHRGTTEAYELAAAGGRPRIENRYRHKDGSLRWVSWVAAPAGEVTYATGRDVTADKERQAALDAAREQLRQSQKMEAVGQLTGGIAHDFNNLLQGIVGALAILQRRVDAGRTEGLGRYTGAAITSAQRAAALTQRLLAFARRQPLDPKPVDANRLVAGMEDLLRRTLGPAVNLEMVLAGGLWPALCDPNQLESAILNLAINARDAMPEGGRLTVETANAHLDDAYARAQGGEVEPGQYVAISVTDTGTGMAPEVAARAFEPFFTTKPLGQGTGLGLSMLYGFAKQSGGHVGVYSEPGQGTTFKLYLPRHRGGLEGAETAAAAEEAPRADPGETVLVVEDEATVRMLILETLEEFGYASVEAADGPSGLRVLRSDTRVDLLVTDVGLPGMDGRQLADAAREARPGLKVLFITGYAHNAAVGNGLLEPGMEMMTKPFAMDALADKIRSMIDKA